MKTIRTILALGAVCSAVVLVGCTHTVDVVVHNPSAKSLPVVARGPGFGVKALGTVPPRGGTLRNDVDIPSDQLPTDLIIEVGKQALTFQISEDVDKVVLTISLKDDKLMKVGKDGLKEEKTIDIKKPVGEPESVIE